jgi:hypothetical protein
VLNYRSESGHHSMGHGDAGLISWSGNVVFWCLWRNHPSVAAAVRCIDRVIRVVCVPSASQPCCFPVYELVLIAWQQSGHAHISSATGEFGCAYHWCAGWRFTQK